MIDADCPACGGSGLVAPSPFHGDFTSWPEWLLGDYKHRQAKKLGRGSSPTLLGMIKPKLCPRCNVGGVVEGNPWNRQEFALIALSEAGEVAIVTLVESLGSERIEVSEGDDHGCKINRERKREGFGEGQERIVEGWRDGDDRSAHGEGLGKENEGGPRNSASRRAKAKSQGHLIWGS